MESALAQSFTFILIHVIFSTKDRMPLISNSIRPELHAYMAGVLRNLNCECYIVGGVEDHVHMAIRIKSSMDLAHVLEKVKSGSSKWIKGKSPGYEKFSWQKGYGAFSISPQYLDPLINYINNQVEHHKKQSFQDEVRGFLAKYKMECDERYLWG